jgi:hypothetical protein
VNIVLGTPQRLWEDFMQRAKMLGAHLLPPFNEYNAAVAAMMRFTATMRMLAYVPDWDQETVVLLQCHGPMTLLRILKHEELHLTLDRIGEGAASHCLDKIDHSIHSPLNKMMFTWRERRRMLAEAPTFLGALGASLRSSELWLKKQAV